MEFILFGLSWIFFFYLPPVFFFRLSFILLYYGSYTSLFTSAISKKQILTFCPDAFVLLHGQRRGGGALPECVCRIPLTDGLQDGSHHSVSCCSSCSWLPTSALGPSNETKLWISMCMGGSRWLKLNSVLKHPHILQVQNED